MKEQHSSRAESILLGSIALVAIVIQCLPAVGEALQWQRSAKLPASLISALTGHLTHWSWDHLMWDLAAFVGLGLASIRVIPGRLTACLLVSAIIIPLEIALFQPAFETYRGLSGIDSALFGLLTAGLWKQGKQGKLLASAGMIGFFGKSLFEFSTGDTLFVDRATGDFIPVSSAHLSGLIGGILAGVTIPGVLTRASTHDFANQSRS